MFRPLGRSLLALEQLHFWVVPVLSFVQRELTCLSEGQSTDWTIERLFACMNEGVLGEVLLAGKRLCTLVALVSLEFEMTGLDMSPEVELGVEAFATLFKHAAIPSHFKRFIGNRRMVHIICHYPTRVFIEKT